jgi:RHS repeat-associated protein
LHFSDSQGGADYSSKEGTNAPKLLIALGGATPQSCSTTATATPTNTPTPGPSPTPTNTLTPSATPAGTNTPTPTAPSAFNNATFVYDGDGKRVKSVVGNETTLFIGAYYEVTNPGANQTVTKYYYAGTQRIALRKYTIPQSMSVEYLLGDHLGSTSLTTDANGNKVSEIRYTAWGEVRYSWTAGLSTTPAYQLPKYTYTGQYSYMSEFGLMFYNARMYDPEVGRFTSADSIVPDNIHGYDRYNYVSNRPTINTDPTGHVEQNDQGGGQSTPSCAKGPTRNAKSNMNKIPISESSSMDTYTSASIGVQNPVMNRVNVAWLFGKYTGEGAAKVSDAEMESGYGDPINNGDNRYGLGLRNPGEATPNQNNFSVAVTAMSTRIQVRLDACEKTIFPCTPTDSFLGAALGGDGWFAPGDLRDLGNGKVYGEPNPSTGIFPWENYLSDPDLDDPDHNRDVIQQFVNNVNYLQQQGAAIPDVNWAYVCGLLEK